MIVRIDVNAKWLIYYACTQREWFIAAFSFSIAHTFQWNWVAKNKVRDAARCYGWSMQWKTVASQMYLFYRSVWHNAERFLICSIDATFNSKYSFHFDMLALCQSFDFKRRENVVGDEFCLVVWVVGAHEQNGHLVIRSINTVNRWCRRYSH